MADISVTAANVTAAGANNENGTAGATITAGQLVYKEATTGQFKLADANSATAEAKAIFGVALNGASSGQPITVLKGGLLTLNAVVTVGEIYVLSGTAGGIAPEADLVSGMTVCLLGVGTTTTTILVAPLNSGAAIP